MYIEPTVESSYRKNNLGKVIYDKIVELKPLKVVEFGILHGYSTLCIAQALRDNGYINSADQNGHLISYDLFSVYPYKHGVKAEVEKLLGEAGLFRFATLKQEDFYEWLDRPEEFDVLHIDVSNNGDIIERAYNTLKPFIDNGSVIIFEGGTKERDNVKWMIDYNKAPMFPLKNVINYKILDDRFPGISIIEREK